MRNLTMAAALSVALTAAGCGGGGGGGASTPTAPTTGGGGATSGGVVTITITGQNGTLAFTPNPATVDGTQKIQFKNNDSVTHHIMLDDGTGQTADIPPGGTSAAIAAG